MSMNAILNGQPTYDPYAIPGAPAMTREDDGTYEAFVREFDFAERSDNDGNSDMNEESRSPTPSPVRPPVAPTPPPVYPRTTRFGWPLHAAPHFIPPQPPENPPPPCAAEVLECSYNPVSQSTTHLWRALNGNLYLSTTMALPTPPHVAARPL